MDVRNFKKPHVMALLLASTTVAGIGQPQIPIKFSKLESRLIDLLTSKYAKKMSKASQVNQKTLEVPSTAKSTTKGLSKRSKSMSLIASQRSYNMTDNANPSESRRAPQGNYTTQLNDNTAAVTSNSGESEINSPHLKVKESHMKGATIDKSPNQTPFVSNSSEIMNRNPRRVFTTPAFDITSDDFDSNERFQDEEESDDEVFHASAVRAKFDRWKDFKSMQASKEVWDEDFEIEPADIIVPGSLQTSQDAVKLEAEHIRKFALHVEDLQSLYSDAEKLAKELQTRYPEQAATLGKEYLTQNSHAQTLITLASQLEDESVSYPEHERQAMLKNMQEILESSKQRKSHLSTYAAPNMIESNDTINDLDEMNQEIMKNEDRETLCNEEDDWNLDDDAKNPLFHQESMPFQLSHLPQLIQHVLHLKSDLSDYIVKLKLINE